MKNPTKPLSIVIRLDYLAEMIGKYRHCWGVNPSARLIGWVDEYNALRKIANTSGLWQHYCKTRNAALDHTSYDLLA